MPVAVLDGIKTNYIKKGNGPALLMLAPKGFDSRIESWHGGKWKAILGELDKHFTTIAYDRREAGLSGGRVEVLTWQSFAQHAKLLLEHLDIERAWVVGPCMGVSVGNQFASLYPETCIGLILAQPVGGWRWMKKQRGLFNRHIAFVRAHGLTGVVKEANSRRPNFHDEPEAGPWSTVIVNDPIFAERFIRQDVDRYLRIVEDTRGALFGDTFVSGPPPEDLVNIQIPALLWPGDDPSHATSAAIQLRELLPQVRYWDTHPFRHTAAEMLEQILRFKYDVENNQFPARLA